ncbi:hypothetical protein [Alkaliphilus hydrothermalis]|uniref:Uncharacterized protein n=1 Tax=Alkaliphilus hydrothermalis TaxID=1482730 RepID=A0ABS2NR49_9FIRM|nr:hypothetical protein [Alkaliphilus hydrothermalis]MBM7615427.1 hypothetical protein [Alkaliphilus hydrothermalis]
MSNKNSFERDQQLPAINRVQPHNYNVMPDGMLEAISPTDLALMAILKDAPKILTEEQNNNKNR